MQMRAKSLAGAKESGERHCAFSLNVRQVRCCCSQCTSFNKLSVQFGEFNLSLIMHCRDTVIPDVGGRSATVTQAARKLPLPPSKCRPASSLLLMKCCGI